MSFFIKHNFSNRLWQALWISIVVACAPAEAQLAAAKQATISKTSTVFDLSGKVTAKSETGFTIRTKDGKTVDIVIDQATDFAMRLSSPWFNAVNQTVVVDGKVQSDGKRERISYSLPKGQLYLLVQFRNVTQRDRIMKQPTWRVNNYLISDQPIESGLPEQRELLLAGKLDLKNSALIVGEKSLPIMLGHRSATLRGRSFDDIVAGETVVVVTGSESGSSKTADTVLFMIR